MNLNIRKVFIIIIFAICIIAITISAFIQITNNSKKAENEENIVIDTTVLIENFNNIFENKVNYQNNQINVSKEKYDKELVYTIYSNQEVKENFYELNVNIPYVNIDNENVKKINTEISNLFYNKAINVLSETDKNIIYDVSYKAYVNDNILSLIIKATLKESNNPQREIIKTYNYNLSSNEELDINKILESRNVSKEYAQSKIYETINNASDNANKYNQLGYSKYLRDINDSMYKIENTKCYFLGENKAIYVIYPYGNSHYTSEMDLLVI